MQGAIRIIYQIRCKNVEGLDMKCECCGRETEVLIEIGAVSPKVSTTGKCCAECCAFILTALENGREDPPVRQAEIIPAEEDRLLVDEDGLGNGDGSFFFTLDDAGII